MRLAYLGVLVAFIFVSSKIGFAQANCINEEEHRPCTESESKEMQDYICRTEPAPANLFVAHPVQLSGTLVDETDAPFSLDDLSSGSKTLLQIKDLKKGAILFEVPLRKDGRFEFKLIPAGNYRMIIVWMKNGKLERPPLFDQPQPIHCDSTGICNVKQIIHGHGTDDPVDQCPPK
jgi:hypothetical protein